MAYIVRDLPPMKTFTSSGGTAVTVGTGSLDDASSITIFFTSSFTGTTTNSALEVSQFDPAIPLQAGVSQSTAWFNLSTTLVTSSGAAITITNISFRGIRATFTATSSQAGEIYAFISKQISV